MSEKPQGFWRRVSGRAPGKVKVEEEDGTRRKPSFLDFDQDNSEAWSDGDDELVQAVKPTSSSTTAAMQPSDPQDQDTAPSTATDPPSKKTVSISQQDGSIIRPSFQNVSDPLLALKKKKFDLLMSSPDLSLDKLKNLSWNGIPSEWRPVVWKLLLGYLPCNQARRNVTLRRKREEYMAFVEQYYDTRLEPARQQDFHQIEIDVKRTCPGIASFLDSPLKEMLERILYIWSIRHPGSGYVQGINDLVLPFFSVFLSPHLAWSDVPFEHADVSKVPVESLKDVEADCYWCVCKILDGIQDNYTVSQPGIQNKIRALGDLMAHVDGPLHRHLEAHDIRYEQFAWRWINCLLMREMPLDCTIRLWDTYLSETDGFAAFHVYACAAFLKTFSEQLCAQNDMERLMSSLQKLPTQSWTSKEIELLLAEAFKWMSTFGDSQIFS